MKKEVHLCKIEVNAMMKQINNSKNLQKIVSLALEVANKEKGELKAQIDELIAKVASFRQQLSGGKGGNREQQ